MLKYDPGSGRLFVTDPTADGSPLVFDTNDGLLCVAPSDVKIGSLSLPSRSASSNGVTSTVIDVNSDHSIESVTPGATVVRGLLRTSWASGSHPLDDLWRSASGSHLDLLYACGSTTSPQTDTNYRYMTGMAFYSFFVDDNVLYMNERVVLRAQDPGAPPAITLTRPACTVYYRLLVGSFAV